MPMAPALAPALVALHVIVMVAATVISQGPAFLLYRAMRHGDVAGIRGILDNYQGLGAFIAPLYIGGVLIGVVTIFVAGFDPFEPWLIIAYVLTVIAFLTPQFVTVPRMLRVGAAAATSPVDAPSDELRAEIARASGPVFWVDAVLIVLFLIDMIVKPFS
jgi:hypothetical protein